MQAIVITDERNGAQTFLIHSDANLVMRRHEEIKQRRALSIEKGITHVRRTKAKDVLTEETIAFAKKNGQCPLDGLSCVNWMNPT